MFLKAGVVRFLDSMQVGMCGAWVERQGGGGGVVLDHKMER